MSCFPLPVGGFKLLYLAFCFLKDIEVSLNYWLPHTLWVLYGRNLKWNIIHSTVFCFYYWKVIPGCMIFEKSYMNWRKAFWKNLLSIISIVTYNKRHNLIPHTEQKKFIWSFRSSSWKGRAHKSWFFRQGRGRGSVGQEPCYCFVLRDT